MGRPARFTRYAALLGRLAGIDDARVLPPGETAPPTASAVVGNMTLLVPMQGLIDPAVELTRLQKKAEKNQQEIKRALAKLENPNFVNNAPPEVVATERERIAQFEKVNESLARQIEIVQGLVPS
jgi:valyl-tRNA synthetase